jgi:hypothetical protein
MTNRVLTVAGNNKTGYIGILYVPVKGKIRGGGMLIGGGSQDRRPGLLLAPGAHLSYRLKHY